MGVCSDCIWFDAPPSAYRGRCVLYAADTVCDHGCASFAPLPALPASSEGEPATIAPVAALMVWEGQNLVRKCGACGSLNMGPTVCNACRTPWRQ